MTVAAATLVVAASAASAQTMKAEIPFAFRAGDRVMAAGTYIVQAVNRGSGHTLFRVMNADDHRPVLLSPHMMRDTDKAWPVNGSGVLAFECGGPRCVLESVWTGYHDPAYRFQRPKLGRDEPSRMAIVTLRPERTE